ncbi:magnesium/cobalt transporter CorA [Streptacidiphilus rugosus]|uniref:magnesium/cobalt transporter CorA n=1 Tax=Streptacidiphilus rugosus TaxID=405783 RepID=UPI00056085BF|nr:magnesium/cobalt transporter CorA [Streptacidiphilus rugosus]
MFRDLRDLRAAVLPRRGAEKGPGAQPARSGEALVDCALYRDGKRVESACVGRDAVAEAAERLRGGRWRGRDERGGKGFVWIGLFEPTQQEFAGIAELFGLHPLAVEDAVNAHQRPKLERYGDVLFTVFKTIRYVEHDHLTPTSDVVDTGEVMAFLGTDFVITVRHGRHGGLSPLRRELEQNPTQLAKGPSAVLHALADHVVDDYLDVIERLQTDVDEIEESVFSSRRSSDAGRIYQLKREVLEFKRACVPMERPLARLAGIGLGTGVAAQTAEADAGPVSPEVRPYFRDVADHLARVNERVAGFDELLNSILQANLAQVSVTQNEDMRKITAWAAILAVPTMVCGVYGMNFTNMPELHWRWGYPTVMVAMVAVCAGLWRMFKKNDWL